MEVFWTALIEPLLSARKPKRIVEIGCECGHNTKHLVDFCSGTGSELHVIDPAPRIDPAHLRTWQRQTGFKFNLHANKSLEALPALPCGDAVLLDGDHNWYTVFHELKCIDELAARSGGQPLILIHDVAWPYARRDMYYDPDAIPEEFRQQSRLAGIQPDTSELATDGWSAHLNHAVHEGGARNGVLTAVEDFLRATGSSYRFQCVPVFHGLGILCPPTLLETNAELAEFLDHLDRHIVTGGLLQQVERDRLRAHANGRQPWDRPSATNDLAALEWTLAALSNSARWRIGDAVVTAGRRLLGLPRAAQVTDTLRDIVGKRRRRSELLASQAAAVQRAESDEALDQAGRIITEAFHQLYYNSAVQTWHRTNWLGVPVWKSPLDLWIYQEIIHETRPDLIIETGTAFGGSALFLASICDQINCGEIVSIDIEARAERSQHPRIRYWNGSSIAAEILEQVAALAGRAARVMVILDSDHRCEHVLAELHAYAPFVSPGCYLVVEDTNVNGHPVFAEHGPGPKEAVDLFLAESADFTVDKSREKFFLTFNPSGYLRRHATRTATQ